jgi:hypothetical protein
MKSFAADSVRRDEGAGAAGRHPPRYPPDRVKRYAALPDEFEAERDAIR